MPTTSLVTLLRKTFAFPPTVLPLRLRLRSHCLGSAILGVGATICLLTATPATTCAAGPEGVSLPGYVMVPLHTEHNALVMDTSVNGRRAALAIDTGSPISVIDSTHARSIQLKYPGDEGVPGNIPKSLHSGSNDWRVAWVADLRAGAMNFGSGPIALVDMPGQRRTGEFGSGSPFANHPVTDGLIGNDVLKRYGAIIDCVRNRIYFNTDPARRMHLDRVAGSTGLVTVPMTYAGRHFFVPANLRGRRFSLMVDTGSFATLLRVGVVRSLGGINLTQHRATSSGFYGSLPIYTLPASDLSIGDFALTRPATIGATEFPSVFGNDGPSGPLLGVLGADSLAYNAALIDCAESKLYLRHIATRGR